MERKLKFDLLVYWLRVHDARMHVHAALQFLPAQLTSAQHRKDCSFEHRRPSLIFDRF
jgi:hypothetical protein